MVMARVMIETETRKEPKESNLSQEQELQEVKVIKRHGI
jgi:hypothetical protein